MVEVGQKLTSRGFINCPECEALVKHVHSAQQDKLFLSRKLQAIRAICTTDHEDKLQFIARVLKVLDGA